MAESNEFFDLESCVAELGILAVPGAEELASKINRHLVEWAAKAGNPRDTFLIDCACPRFQSGDA